MTRMALSLVGAVALAAAAGATEYHVALDGRDSSPGTREAPFRTIQHAADAAQPGDTITVHEGVYRERVNPPRGGRSDAKRIVYQAAPGEKVEIKGSEVVRNWTRVEDDVWKAEVPNSFFGGFNPFADLIHGDWFDPKGRKHHTGAVYLDGEWLIEAARLEDVLERAPGALRGGRSGSPGSTRRPPRSGRSSRESTRTGNSSRSTSAGRSSIRTTRAGTTSRCAASPCATRPRRGRRPRPSRSA